MRVLYGKLASGGGETLAETVVSILIVALASVIFATMTMSASYLNAAAKTADAAYYDQLSAAETRTGAASGTARVSWSGAYQDFAVTITGADGELNSYGKTGGGGG